MRDGLGMDKIMGFYISFDLIFSITFVSVMYFHNHSSISISPKILKEIFAQEAQLCFFLVLCHVLLPHLFHTAKFLYGSYLYVGGIQIKTCSV